MIQTAALTTDKSAQKHARKETPLPKDVGIPDLSNYQPTREGDFYREYEGAQADRLIHSLKRLIEFKGGEWRRGVNIVAVEGLRLNGGLHPNEANAFDDTLLFVLDRSSQGKAKSKVLAARGTTYSGLESIPKDIGYLNKLDPRFQHELTVGSFNVSRFDAGWGAAVPADWSSGRLPGIGMNRSGKYVPSTTITDAKIHWTPLLGKEFTDDSEVNRLNRGCPTVASARDEFVGTITRNYLQQNGGSPFLLSIINKDALPAKFLPPACTPEAPGY